MEKSSNTQWAFRQFWRKYGVEFTARPQQCDHGGRSTDTLWHPVSCLFGDIFESHAFQFVTGYGTMMFSSGRNVPCVGGTSPARNPTHSGISVGLLKRPIPSAHLFKTFDHGVTTCYNASRNCGQACLDDHACISYDFEVGLPDRLWQNIYSVDNVAGEPAQRKPAMGTACPHLSKRLRTLCDLVYAWRRVFGILHAVFERGQSFSTRHSVEACAFTDRGRTL